MIRMIRMVRVIVNTLITKWSWNLLLATSRHKCKIFLSPVKFQELTSHFETQNLSRSFFKENMLVCIRVNKCTLTAKKWQRVQNRWVKRFLLHIIFAIYVATYTFSSAKLFVWESCWRKKIFHSIFLFLHFQNNHLHHQRLNECWYPFVLFLRLKTEMNNSRSFAADVRPPSYICHCANYHLQRNNLGPAHSVFLPRYVFV